MRTTITMDDDAYALARAIAAQRGETLGQTLGNVVRERFRPYGASDRLQIDDQGWPVIHIGRAITPEEVANAIAED